MSLSINEILEKAKKGIRDSRLREAMIHEDRLELHAKPVVEKYQLSPYYREWREDFPFMLLPADKASRVESIISLPLSTVDITDSIFSEISRIFNAQNKSINYEFTSREEREDFEKFLKDKFNVNQFIQEDLFMAYKWAINSIVVIDLPEEQNSLRPEPYALVLSIDDVLSASPLKGGGFEYVLYKSGDDYYLVTTESYVKANSKFEIVKIVPHGLGYCPAHFVCSHLVSSDNPFNHLSPITNVLGELDWFLFFHPSKKYNDLTGAFPVYVAYEQECDYEDDSGTCENGFLGGDRQKPCPQCAKKTFVGPGSLVNVPAPLDKDDPDLGRYAMTKLDADTGSLNYCKDEIASQRKHIFESCVGVDHGENVDVAKNEKQVDSLYESRINVLMRIKSEFEIIHKWIVSVFADIRYGESYFKGCSVNYGTEFFLRTLTELYSQYTKAKADGLPDSELDSIYEEIINVKHKNNDTQRNRLRLLLNLEPFPHKNIPEITALYKGGLINKEDFVIKINFNSFVKRFERENGSIEEFGSLIDLKTRIENIYQTFMQYVRETSLPSPERGGGSLPS